MVATMLAAAGQSFGDFRFYEPPIRNPDYDGRFTFARIKFVSAPGGYGYCGLPAWAHGYQSCRGGSRAETRLMRILNEISLLGPRIEDEGYAAPIARSVERTSEMLDRLGA